MNGNVLETAGLSVVRPGVGTILGGVSLGIAPGERVALIGPNGAGKTTLLLAMTGILPPSAGSIRVDGRPLVPGGFHPEIGFLFQQAEDQLFSPTVREDVAFGARNLGIDGAALDQAVDAVLRRIGIEELADRPVHHLSGGEKRLACLAGVLVMKPQVLLLDEPSSALDLRNRRRLIELLRGMDQAMLIASHDLELALELCARVLLVDDGRVVADGPARLVLGDAELMRRHGQEVPHSLTPHAGAGHRHPA